MIWSKLLQECPPPERYLVYLGRIQVKIQQTKLLLPRTLWRRNACRFCCYCCEEDGLFVIDITHRRVQSCPKIRLENEVFPYYGESKEACESSVSSWQEEVGQAVARTCLMVLLPTCQKKPCGRRAVWEFHSFRGGGLSLLKPNNVLSHLINASYKFSWTETPIPPTANFIREFC